MEKKETPPLSPSFNGEPSKNLSTFMLERQDKILEKVEYLVKAEKLRRILGIIKFVLILIFFVILPAILLQKLLAGIGPMDIGNLSNLLKGLDTNNLLQTLDQ